MALRFYESGYGENPPLEQIVYARRFASETSRYINWELHLSHPAPERRVDFSIIAVYYRVNVPSWEEIWRGTLYANVEKGRLRSTHAWGISPNDSKSWEIGTYRVDLYVEGKNIASEQFQIY
jgi:hypothetical protein